MPHGHRHAHGDWVADGSHHNVPHRPGEPHSHPHDPGHHAPFIGRLPMRLVVDERTECLDNPSGRRTTKIRASGPGPQGHPITMYLQFNHTGLRPGMELDLDYEIVRNGARTWGPYRTPTGRRGYSEPEMPYHEQTRAYSGPPLLDIDFGEVERALINHSIQARPLPLSLQRDRAVEQYARVCNDLELRTRQRDSFRENFRAVTQERNNLLDTVRALRMQLDEQADAEAWERQAKTAIAELEQEREQSRANYRLANEQTAKVRELQQDAASSLTLINDLVEIAETAVEALPEKSRLRKRLEAELKDMVKE